MLARRLSYAVTMRGRRGLFSDVVSAVGGGPDFRLRRGRRRWRELQLAAVVKNVLDFSTADLQDDWGGPFLPVVLLTTASDAALRTPAERAA